MKIRENGGAMIQGRRIKDLSAADDIDFLAERDGYLQMRFIDVHPIGENFGQHINREKQKRWQWVATAQRKRA